MNLLLIFLQNIIYKLYSICVFLLFIKNLSDYYQFLLKKRIEVNKKTNLSSEKLKNSGKCFYDYAHSFIRADF